jgi:O-antigen/teichoic acid export membrane protein
MISIILRKSLYRQVAINALTQWGVTALSAILGLLVVPFLIHKLGQDGYGLVAVVLAIAAMCALADMGISGALARQLAEALAKNDSEEFNEYASTAVVVNIAAGLTCACALFFCAVPIARLAGMREGLFGKGVALLQTFGTSYLFLTFVMFVPRAVLAGHNRFDLANVIDAARRLAQSIGLLAILSLTSMGLRGWAGVCIAVEICNAALLWRAAFRIRREFCIGWRFFRTTRLRSMLGLGSQLTILQISNQLSTSTDPFILSACLSPASVSLYRPPVLASSALAPMVLTIANQLHPLTTQAHVQGDRNALLTMLLEGTKYTMLMGAVACGIVIPLAYPLCRVWLSGALGEQYRICAAVLTIQMLTQLATFASGTQWAVLLGMRKVRFLAYGRLALAVVNIVGSWLLVKYTALGVLGVVIPTMVIEFAWRPMLAQYTCRIVGLDLQLYLRRSYLRPLLIGFAIGSLGFAVRYLSTVESFWMLLSVAVSLALFGAALVWFMGFSLSERNRIWDIARSLLLRPSNGSVIV